MQARKLGLKAAHTGETTYLCALDEMVEKVNGLPHISLGLKQIPVERIVGTLTKARTNAFAENFMPVLEPKTEFGLKWSKLYDAIVL
ncbi:MAG: BMP family ABC transporter substrate-binding protein, partial [Clostridia bacterium]|nr:BMP family ABC transporter substrate-binding protein [Clostridia bacterium]